MDDLLTVESPPGQDAGYVDRDQEVEGVPPRARVLEEAVCHSRRQRGAGDRHQVTPAVCKVSVFHGHQLGHGPEERLLEGNGDTNQCLCADDGVDVGSHCAGDGAE